MVWIGSIWLRIGDQWRALVNTVMNLRVKRWEVLEWLHNWQLFKRGLAP
jgi:hypothetical protein